MAEDLDLDFDDDDLGLDDDLGDLGDLDPFAEPPPPKNKREAITRTLKSGVKGFTEDIKDDPLKSASEIAMAAMPKKLSGETAIVTDIKDKLKDEITEAGQEIKSQASSTISAAERILPKNETVSKVANKLKNMLGVGEDEVYERKKTAEELNNEQIDNTLSEALGAKDKRAEYEDLLNKQIELNRFKDAKELARTTASNTELLNKFNREVTANYYRRSLEAQYKHLFIAKQQLDVLGAGFDGFKNQLDAIANNTGLPEYVKLRKSEALASTIKGRMYEGITDKLYNEDNVFGRIRDNLSNKVSGVKDNVLSSFGMIRDTADAGESAKEMSALGGGAGGMAGSLLGGWLKEYVGEKLGERLEKDEKTKAAMFKAKTIATDIPGFIQDIQPKRTYNDDGNETLASKAKNSGLSFIKDIVGKEADINTAKIHTEDINDVGLFDNRTKASINKVIPGLLSKIYGEIKSMRTGGKPEDNEVFYDHKSEDFKLKKDISKTIENKVKSKLSKDTLYYVNAFINDLQEYGGLEIKDELEDKQIRKAVISYIINGGSLAPTKLLNKKFLNHFNSRLKGRVTKAVKAMLKEGKEDIDVLDSVNSHLKSIKTSLPSIEEDVNELSKSGNLKELEKLGLVKRDKLSGAVSFDNDRYKKMLIDETTKFNNADLKTSIARKQEAIDEAKKKEEESVSLAEKLRVKVKDKVKKYTGSDGDKETKFPKPTGFSDLKKKAAEYGDDAKKLAEDQLKKAKDTRGIQSVADAKKLVKDQLKKAKGIKDNATIADAKKLAEDQLKKAKGIKDNATIADAKKLAEDTYKSSKKKLDISNFYKATKEDYETLKTEFQNSDAYKNGIIKTIDDFAHSLNITIPKDIKVKSLKVETEKKKKEAKKQLDIKSKIIKKKKDKLVKEAKAKIKDTDVKSKLGKAKDFVKEHAGSDKEFYDKAKSTVSTIGSGAKSAMGVTIGISGSAIGSAIKGLRSKKTKNFLKKTHSLDRKIAGGAVKLLGKGIGKAGLGILKSPVTGTAAVARGAGWLGSKLLGKKKSEANAKLFDADGDGDRDGNWKDRLNLFKKKPKKDDEKSTSGKKDANSGFGLNFSTLLTIAGGVLAIGKKIFGGVTSVIKTVASVGENLLKPLTGIGKTLLKLPLTLGKALFSMLSKGGLLGGAVNLATKAGGTVVKGGKALWSGAKSLFGFGSKEVAKTASKKVAKTTTKKVAKKVAAKTATSVAARIGVKGSAKLAAKVASRAIPFLGWGLAAWDAVNIGKKMLMDGKSFKSAVSEQMLGVDITDDAAGQPIPSGEKPINKNDDKSPDSKSQPVKPIPARGGPLADNTLEHVLPANRKVNISGMNPAFKDNLARMANEYYELTGKNIVINSGYRSRAYQAALRAKYGSRAAKPGHSLHEFGLAFDTDTKTANALDELGLMRKYGFTRPVGKETWHVESAGIQHAIPKVKKDPGLAVNLVANSLGIGGGGWGLLPNVRKYSRNLKYQLALTKATPTKPKGSELTKKLAIKPANNISKTKPTTTKVSGSKKTSLAALDKVKSIHNETTKTYHPDAEKHPDVSLNKTKDKHKTLANKKLELHANTKPVLDLHRTTLHGNKLLDNVDKGIQDSVKIQLKMLEVLTNIEKNMGKTSKDIEKEIKKENTETQERVRTEFPKPTIDLGRRTKFAS